MRPRGNRRKWRGILRIHALHRLGRHGARPPGALQLRVIAGRVPGLAIRDGELQGFLAKHHHLPEKSRVPLDIRLFNLSRGLQQHGGLLPCASHRRAASCINVLCGQGPVLSFRHHHAAHAQGQAVPRVRRKRADVGLFRIPHVPERHADLEKIRAQGCGKGSSPRLPREKAAGHVASPVEKGSEEKNRGALQADRGRDFAQESA